MKSTVCCSALLAGIFIVGVPARAADNAPAVLPASPIAAPVASPWQFTVALYLWGAGMKGDVATLPPLPVVSVNAGFDDIIRHLDGAVMAAGEIRNDRFLVAFDVMYTRLGDKVGTPGPFFSSVSLDTSSFVGTLLAGYRVVDSVQYSLDVMAGIRGYSVWTRLRTSSVIPALNLTRENTEGWVDPMIGAKTRINLNPKWYLSAWGFVGGFGVSSDFSWDVMASVGYAFSDTWSGMLGYRALGVDFTSGPFVYDVVQHGPFVALVARF